ncbi:hypothetical protein [Sphingobacterium faecium]
MRKLLNLLVLFLLSTSVYSQQFVNSLVNTSIPPSPNASSLLKFGNSPVSQSTGLPEIKIPIFQYSSGDLELPISLNYHAGGVRVEEQASNCGLGWGLIAGGVVSRSVRGVYDEFPLGGFINSTELPQSVTSGNSPMAEYDRPFNKIHRNELDPQNDVFSFSFGGTTGNFYLGKNNDILIAPQRKLKIEKRISNIKGIQLISGFDIIDEIGRKYVFNAYEVTTHFNGQSNNTFTSSWYLTEIHSADRTNVISFQYSDYNIDRFYLGRSFSERRLAYTGSGLISSNNTIDQMLSGKRIQSINFPNGVVASFSYDATDRTDLKGDYALKKIEILGSSQEKKIFNLEHDYSLNRLTLKKVIPSSGIAGEIISSYDLSYQFAMPDRTSFKQDHWGFYNNNGVNNLIPEETFPGGLTGLSSLPGGDRSVSSTHCIAGSLNKIKYPTGGYTIFEMGPNIVYNSIQQVQSYAGGLRANRILDYDGTSINPVQIKEYEYLLENSLTSSGELGVFPVYSYSVYYEGADPYIVMQHTYQEGAHNYIIRSSSPVNNLSNINGSPVSYSRVVEKIIGKVGLNMGKTVKKFTTGSPITYSYFPYVPPSVRSWNSGLLTSEAYYDHGNRIIKKTDYEYGYAQDYFYQNNIRLNNFRNLTIAPVKFRTAGSGVDVFGAPVYFLMRDFFPESGRSFLNKSSMTKYDTLGAALFSEQRMFSYDNTHYFMRTDTLVDSQDRMLVNSFKYVPDRVLLNQDPNNIYGGMVAKNMNNVIVEQIVELDGVNLSTTKIDYYKPYNEMFVPNTITKQIKSNTAVVLQKFLSYSNKGRPIEYEQFDNVIAVYLWGYNGQYPIAEIKNATYADVLAVLTQATIDNLNNPNHTEATMETLIKNADKKLRTDSRLAKAMVTTFTYKPLSGIASKTDIRGITEYYQYDSFQRLQQVMDFDSNIQKNFQYNYRP